MAEPTAPVFVGKVHDTEGALQKGGTVELHVLAPRTSNGIILVGEAGVSSTGRFKLTAEGARLWSAAVDRAAHRGDVTLEVSAVSARGERTSSLVPASLSARSASGFVNEVGETTSTIVLQQGYGVVPKVKRSRPKVAVDGSTTAAAAAKKPKIKSCKGRPSGGILYVTPHRAWKPTKKTKRVWVPLQSFRTGKKSKAKYSWSTAEETKLGVAAYGTKGWVSAGTSYSVSKKVETGIDAEYGPRRSVRLDAQWEYKLYREGCYRLNKRLHWTGNKQWRPIKYAGFNRDKKVKPAFKCEKKWTGKISQSTWVSRTQTKTWASSFAIKGVKLDLSQGVSSKTKKTWAPSGAKSVKICGRGGYPVDAADVRAK